MAQIFSIFKNFTESLLSKGQAVIDGIFPPEKRSEVLAKLQTFAIANPKLAGFLLTNIALTGLPLLLFITFTITVFVFSLVAALLVGLLAALLFTAFMVGVALLVVLPTVFITTMGATFLFLWGLGGYYILKWFNEGEMPAPEGSAIGDKLNNLTGGRLDFLMDGVRATPLSANGSKDAGSGEKHKSHGEESDGGTANGGPVRSVNKGVSSATKNVDTGKVTNTVAGVQKKAGSTVGTAKGVVSGATGLG